MKSKLVKIITSTLILIALTNCNYHTTSGTDSNTDPSTGLGEPPASGPGGGATEPTVRWNDVKANVFNPSCTSCHSLNRDGL